MFTYCGRFAPTPSGQLHFGSLIAALGSYLRAKSCNGRWLLRIEDIDTPRCNPAYSADIVRCLEQFGFAYDGDIWYQSQRHEIYQYYLDKLTNAKLTYACNCTREQIKALGGLYLGTCRSKHLPLTGAHSIRFLNSNPVLSFTDYLHGVQSLQTADDFILRRKDGLFAYNLVSVVDDALAGVTEIVRGADLMEGTFRQLTLAKALDFTPCNYCHLPLAIASDGRKLSKQNHALPLDPAKAPETLKQALSFLGQEVPLGNSCQRILEEAVANFKIQNIPLQNKLICE